MYVGNQGWLYGTITLLNKKNMVNYKYKIEYELRGENLTDAYREIFNTPIIMSQMEGGIGYGRTRFMEGP